MAPPAPPERPTMTLANTPAARIAAAEAEEAAFLAAAGIANDEVCVDCEDAMMAGFTGCGECEAPGEAWEYTTPPGV